MILQTLKKNLLNLWAINMSFYTDEELRALVLPQAITLVNVETQRVLGNCNTKVIAEIVTELANIVKYGSVTKPDAAPMQEVLPPIQPQAPVFA